MWCNRWSESPVWYLSGISLQCGGVQDPWLSSVDMYWPALLALAYWPGRQSLEYCWSLLDNFFLNLRCTFLRTYNVHCDSYILKIYFVSVFLDSGRGYGSPKSFISLPPEDSWSSNCYCTQEEWQQKSVPASGIFIKMKPDSYDKMNQK